MRRDNKYNYSNKDNPRYTDPAVHTSVTLKFAKYLNELKKTRIKLWKKYFSKRKQGEFVWHRKLYSDLKS